MLGEQPDDDAHDVMDETHPACDPAHRPRELDRIAAQRIGRGGQAPSLLGVGHHRFEGVELTRKPAARQSGSRLKVVWLSGQYQRAMCVPRGVLRV